MKTQIPTEIAVAARSIEEAERAIEAALAILKTTPRAEKVKISLVMEEAFHRLHAARAILVALELLAEAESSS